ncbi:MAG: hypothetical protein CML20_10115 [Rheinheimera sp.]|uniref:hypothetical protein n=1 Tax=Arsukibacterium sp. UBA3155 TaxID=1946058 RepID=UPI000C93777E|nr:hypothetical protein [Arsukibacterium sp. UBA3155]MAD75127.1 hypothetical protein [Rheinheimera sp.]|tara:strand:+ start:53360 stop:54070 length:711 start_codon:yes stop_codon:yes gene_type:complete
MPATTNAALKMAAPGELCSQIKKLMVFCKDEARSIKAMRHHLAVTEAVVRDFLAQALEQKLLWRQSNGMYKTFNNKISFIDTPANEPETNNSLRALASEEQSLSNYDQQLNTHWEKSCEATDSENEAAATDTQQQLEAMQQPTALPNPDEEVIELDIAAEPLAEYSSAFDINAELESLAGLLQPDQYPVIDDIADKQRALSGISLIIKPHAPQLVNVLDQLAADLAVICLHQNRRA